MGVDTRTSDLNPDVLVVALSGRLDVQTTHADSPVVAQALQQSGGLIVDMDAVHFISSAGLAMLLSVRQEAERTGKKLAVIRAKPPAYKIFKIAALDGVFRFFESEADAVQTLWG